MAMPRFEVPYEKTWIFLFKDAFSSCDIIDKSARGTTSTRLVTEGGFGIDLLELYNPQKVILHFGITECAPRLFKKKGFEYFTMNRIFNSSLRTKYIKWVKKHRVRDPHLTDVSPEIFNNNLENYITRAKDINCDIYMIAIAPPSSSFKEKSPFISENITTYNNILKSLEEKHDNFVLSNPYQGYETIDHIAIDELHIDDEGQNLIFEEIKKHF